MPASKKRKRKIVYKVENEDPKEVYCTTYQMRNFYKQLGDGFFSSLDIMNYIQHHKVVTMMRKGDRVLDVCCGRGLLLPLIRYHARHIAEYVGVDISERNISEQLRRSGIKMIDDPASYYPFKLTHVICSCEEMTEYLERESFDIIVYTSAIEHMQKEAGYQSLRECFDLLKRDGCLFLSCPNTIDKKDPYDVQYAAHLYEWDLEELSQALTEIGFSIYDVFGLVAKVRDFEEYVKGLDQQEQNRYWALKRYLPTSWLMAFCSILYPEAAAEVALIAGKKKGKKKGRERTLIKRRSKNKAQKLGFSI